MEHNLRVNHSCVLICVTLNSCVKEVAQWNWHVNPGRLGSATPAIQQYSRVIQVRNAQGDTEEQRRRGLDLGSLPATHW